MSSVYNFKKDQLENPLLCYDDPVPTPTRPSYHVTKTHGGEKKPYWGAIKTRLAWPKNLIPYHGYPITSRFHLHTTNIKFPFHEKFHSYATKIPSKYRECPIRISGCLTPYHENSIPIPWKFHSHATKILFPCNEDSIGIPWRFHSYAMKNSVPCQEDLIPVPRKPHSYIVKTPLPYN